MKDFNPSPYSNTDTDENLAYSILINTINQKFIKQDIKTRDKYPNSDGYLEIVDEKQIPLGKLEIQLRKIPKDSKKYPVSKELFAYSIATTLPFIIICVDTENKICYWKQIFIDYISDKDDQDSYTINFYDNNIINEKLSYLFEWTNLIKDYQNRIQNYKHLENKSKIINHLGNNELDISPEHLKRIQLYIDKINNLLDNKYDIVKKIIFSNIWKFGIEIKNFDENNLSYNLYGIINGTVDTLIKKTSHSSLFLNNNNSVNFKSIYSRNNFLLNEDNIIEKNAYNTIYDYLIDIIKNKDLIIKSKFLFTEYIINFIDDFLLCLNLEKKDTYTLTEIIYSLTEYLPRWCLSAINYINEPIHTNYLDISMIRTFLPSEKRNEVHNLVIKEINENKDFIPFFVKAYDYSFKIIFDAINYFKENNIQKIERIYKKRNLDLLRNKKTSWIWDGFTEIDNEYNLKIFFDNLFIEYKYFLILNNLYYNELKNIEDYNRIVILHSLKENYNNDESPFVLILYLNNNKNCNDITYIKSDHDNFIEIMKNDVYIIDDLKYNILKTQSIMARFLFDKTPMLNFIYNMLDNKIKDNLKK